MRLRITMWVLLCGGLALLVYGYLNEIERLREEREATLAFGRAYKSNLIHVAVRRAARSYVLINSAPTTKDNMHPEPVFSDRTNLRTWSATIEGSQEISDPEIDRLLSALLGLSFNVRIPLDSIHKPEAELGLSPAFATIEVSYIGGQETIYLGMLHKHGDKRYAKVASMSGIFLLSERELSELLGPFG